MSGVLELELGVVWCGSPPLELSNVGLHPPHSDRGSVEMGLGCGRVNQEHFRTLYIIWICGRIGNRYIFSFGSIYNDEVRSLIRPFLCTFKSSFKDLKAYKKRLANVPIYRIIYLFIYLHFTSVCYTFTDACYTFS